MSMRGGTRRGRDAFVDPRAFAWDPAVVATLRHVSLPWSETLPVVPLANLTSGPRDRLSLLAQFAAHQALLQFAGMADGELDPAEWGVVQKRAHDVRLVRLSARACDPQDAPPVLTIAQQFAELVQSSLEILRQSWARADAIYAEAWSRVARDIASDRRWLDASAAGATAAPGPDALRHMEAGRLGYEDAEDCIESLRRFAALTGAFEVMLLRGASPLEPYSALAGLVTDSRIAPSNAAEQILAAGAGRRLVFVVADPHAFDEGSRKVVDLVSRGGDGTWLIPGESRTLAPTTSFIVAPRLAARQELIAAGVPVSGFVRSPAFGTYLTRGEVPCATTVLPALAEPARSYIAALALLGTRISQERAIRFLGDFLFNGTIQELAIEGVTAVDGDDLVFASETVRAEVCRLIPAASRPAICRVAATHATGPSAALLWLDAGEPARACELLENSTWETSAGLVAALRQMPVSLLTPALASRFGQALIDCGCYREAREIAPGDELVLARAERRTGDYVTALRRVERLPVAFETILLRAELLRLLDRDAEAQEALRGCIPTNAGERARLTYEQGLHNPASPSPDNPYLADRLATYRALERGDYAAAAASAASSHQRAGVITERIDASLDRVFTAFSAGLWDDARVAAIEALEEVEETEGDRAAGGILFTLAYLAADQGQWAHASLRIARLRHFYAATGDSLRLAELQLLDAQLDFCRGRFAAARRAAQRVVDERRFHDQIREAAALILDELDWMQGMKGPRRSSGGAGNVELRRRQERVAACLQGGVPDTTLSSVPQRLFAFRAAIAQGDHERARTIGKPIGIEPELEPSPTDVELRVLRAAATRDFPFGPHDFEVPWCYTTRNRLGHWSAIGSEPGTPDGTAAGEHWIEISDRERLYLEGAARWSTDARDAVAAIFRHRAENHRLRRVVEQEDFVRPARAAAIDGIVGQSAAIREVDSIVARVARRDVPVCITGESGTGKELVARAIHRQSSRRQKVFTPVNCAALPENLVESELFGHVRGAFTGADRDRAGLIETSDGGTLFLDEIGELPLPAQAKLLRFLQEGEFRRVGDSTNRSADVRIVSATNRRLDAAVEEGRFRDDLYYRVRGAEIALPPLRERGADVLLLAGFFLEAERDRHRTGPAFLAPEVEAIFTAYAWPGNVRELQNTIRAAHAMAGESREIALEHLPERLRGVTPSRTVAGSYQDAVARFKRELIERSLLSAAGNQNRAAATLKMSRQALAYQIRELGIMVR